MTATRVVRNHEREPARSARKTDPRN